MIETITNMVDLQNFAVVYALVGAIVGPVIAFHSHILIKRDTKSWEGRLSHVRVRK